MKSNLGKTKMPTKLKVYNNLNDFDCLPPPLREWLRNAILPWSTKSVQRIYNRALSEYGDSNLALLELNRLQNKQLLKYNIK